MIQHTAGQDGYPRVILDWLLRVVLWNLRLILRKSKLLGLPIWSQMISMGL